MIVTSRQMMMLIEVEDALEQYQMLIEETDGIRSIELETLTEKYAIFVDTINLEHARQEVDIF